MYQEGQFFKGMDYTQDDLETGEYEGCTFENCDFSGSVLADVKFTDCTFVECNLSLSKMRNTALRNVQFTDCKILGVLFDACNPFGMSVRFEGCTLNHSSFYQLSLKDSVFENCSLNEVDFTECNLASSSFASSDLTGAKFEKTNLERADFRTAVNFTIHPEINKLKGAKFSRSSLPGLLTRYRLVISE